MDVDPVLKVIVELSTRMATDTEGQAETGITLCIGGLLISGYIITARQFSLSHPIPDRFVELSEAEFKSSGIFTDDSSEYIHLRDAQFFIPDHRPIPTNGGVFWRGRLSAVAGFNFGVLGLPRSNDHVERT